MKLFTKNELIEQIRAICNSGWYKSVKKTIDTRNDGAVGNTLEHLLGIESSTPSTTIVTEDRETFSGEADAVDRS